MNKFINHRILRNSFILFVLLLSSSMYATHIVGGSMAYRCLGNNNYEISLTIARDCYNGKEQFDDPGVVGIFRASDGWFVKGLGELGSGVIQMSKPNDTLNDIVTSDCVFIGTQLCVETAVYRDTVNLPYLEEGFILSYMRCCRTSILNNIIDPLETGSAYFVYISNESQQLCNSSPVFDQKTAIVICEDEQFEFDFSAVDIDGDSLVYNLYQPHTALSLEHPDVVSIQDFINNPPPFEKIQYQSPYSLDDLMGGVPLVLDSHTGLLTGKPNLVGQFLIGVSVEEFRDGVSLGTSFRDFDINVRICKEATVVSFFGEPIKNGLTIEFTNTSTGADTYVWYFDYPNEDPLFKSNEINPVFTYADTGDYKVVLIATRGADGCGVQMSKAVEVINYAPFNLKKGIWRYDGGTFGGEPEWHSSQFYTDGDTMINGKDYYKLYNYTETRRNFPPLFSTSSGYNGAIRNVEGKRIGFIRAEETEETIIYDFNLSLGDTISDNNENKIVVVFTDSIEYCGVSRKRYHLKGIEDGVELQYLIEGIGFTAGLIDPIFYQFEYENTLVCYTELSEDCEGCDLILSRKIIEPEVLFEILPNPNNGKFELLSSQRIEEVTIFNNMGESVYRETGIRNKNFAVDVNLGNGLYYILVINSDKQVSVERIVILK